LTTNVGNMWNWSEQLPGQKLHTQIISFSVSFEAFTAVMFRVDVFWSVTLYSVVVGYQHIRVPCCLHLVLWCRVVLW